MSNKLKWIVYLGMLLIVGLFSYNIHSVDSVKSSINYDIKYAISTVLEPILIVFTYTQFEIVAKCINHSYINIWHMKLPIQQSNTYG